MNYRRTKSGLNFSELGLGCMNLPLDNSGEAILDYAFNQGINYFDTADLYQKGQNESFIGDFLKKHPIRDQVLIGSKVGNAFTIDDDNIRWDPSRRHIMDSIKDSLRRLKLDYLDLYMLHGGTIEDNKDETIDAFNILKQDGLIRAYGISSIRPNVINYYLEHSEIDVIMMQFNPLDNRPESLVPKIREHHVEIIARGPNMKGLFTSNYEKIINNKFDDGLLGYSQQELLAALQDAAANNQLTQSAYAYLLKQPVASIVTGASTLEQLKENISNYQALNQQTNDIRQHFKDMEYEEHLK